MIEIIFPIIVLGSCIGSFLNVVIYRLPKKKSFILNRSHCPFCLRKLNVMDLFPIISWFFLKGKCRYCSNSISIRYPFVELITSILFALCLVSRGWINNSSPNVFVMVSGCILVSYLIILSFIDIDNLILPDSVTYSGSLVGFLLLLYYNFFINNSIRNLFLNHIYAYIIALFGCLIFSFIVKLIIKKPGLGGGDAKLFAMSGAWLGLAGLEVTIVLSFLISASFVLFGFIFRYVKRGEYIPFGPFICVSTFLVWFFGPHFWIESLGDIFWWKYL